MALLAAALWHCGPPPAVRLGWQPLASPDVLLAMSAANLEALQDLTAEARIEIDQPEGRQSASAAVLYRHPGMFRLDVHGPLFIHILTALVRGDSLTVLSQGQTRHSADAGQLLFRMTDLYLGDYDVGYALVGLVEPGRIDAAAAIEYPRADRAIVTLAAEGAIRRRLWLDLSSGFVTGEEVADDGGFVLWRRELRGYRLLDTRRGALYLPRSVRIRQGDLTIDIDYRSHLVNRDLSPDVLLQGIPVWPQP